MQDIRDETTTGDELRTPAAALALLLALTTALSACGSDQGSGVDPATATEDDFLGGTCLVIAADVLGLRRLAATDLKTDLERGSLEPGERRALVDATERLRQGLGQAGGPLTEPLDELVASLDDVEDRIATNTYEDGPGYLARLQAAADDVTRACT